MNTNKYTLTLKQNLPFAQNPRFCELEKERILTDDVRFPWESHPHNLRLWVIGNEYGAMGAVWADCEGDAIDSLIDADLAGGIMLEESDIDEDERDEIARGGNAGEPYDTSHLWMGVVDFDKVRDFDLIVALAEARGACADNLDKI